MVPEKLTFMPLARRQIETDFSGGHITSDAGLLLLREVDKQHRLTQRLASILNDPRSPQLVRHKLETMTRQRVFGVAAGYEDLNDHDALRFDQALQPAMGEDNTLVRFIRQYWPDTRNVFRGDSGFYRSRLLSWCDRNNVDYLWASTRTADWFKYQARPWKYPRVD